MKIKALSNQGDVIFATIVYTVILLALFGGLAAGFNNMLWLIPFFIGLKLLLCLMLRKLKGVIFHSDKLEVSSYGLSDRKMIYTPDQVILKKVSTASVRSPRNAFNLFIGEKHVGMFKLNDYEGEFEKFLQLTKDAGYTWKKYMV